MTITADFWKPVLANFLLNERTYICYGVIIYLVFWAQFSGVEMRSCLLAVATRILFWLPPKDDLLHEEF
jgi:hypothetical protein